MVSGKTESATHTVKVLVSNTSVNPKTSMVIGYTSMIVLIIVGVGAIVLLKTNSKKRVLN